MNIIRSTAFTAQRPWGALDIANLNGITAACTGPISRTGGI